MPIASPDDLKTTLARAADHPAALTSAEIEEVREGLALLRSAKLIARITRGAAVLIITAGAAAAALREFGAWPR